MDVSLLVVFSCRGVNPLIDHELSSFTYMLGQLNIV